MLKAIAHRPVQACVIAALSALVTACAVLTPLYQRALERASVAVTLDHAAAGEGGLQLISDGVLVNIPAGVDNGAPPLTPEALTHEVPAGIARSFHHPVDSRSVAVGTAPGARYHSVGPLVWRDGACAHLELAAGSCPTGSGQVVISTADAENFELRPGSRIAVVEDLPPNTPNEPATATLTVSGSYRSETGPYWDGWQLTGSSGTQPDRGDVAHDTWITDEPTFDTTTWVNPSTRIDLRVDRAAVGVDELLRLGPEVAALQRRESAPREGPSVRVRSGLASLAQTVREGRDQARTTVPALMVPLGLLGLVVLWMALGAAAEQRRPEVALARLRGRGVTGARGHLLRELLAVVLAGVPVGVVVAVGLAWLARAVVLPGDVPLELRLPVAGALLLSVAAVTATAVLVSARVSREPIASLLRRVPPRRTGWALGTADAVAVTAAALIVGAFATGRVSGPVAVAAPAVLALAVGLVLSRLAIPVATRAGRGLLRRGRAGPAVALLQLSRRPGTRSVVALLTVASAILVFAADAVAVGSRNRDIAAAQQVGAPVVATIGGGSVAALQDVVASLGRDADEVTPVVVQHSAASNDQQTNLYVVPDAFGRIASVPDRPTARAALRRLAPPDVDPLAVSGTHLLLDLATTGVQLDAPVTLSARLLNHGAVDVVQLATLRPGTTARHPVDVPIDCADGCVLTGWSIGTVPANDVSGSVVVSAVRTDRGGPVRLGTRDDWSVPDPAASDALTATTAADGSLDIGLDNEGRSEVVLQHRWVPDVLPAVTSGSLPSGGSARFFEGTGLDGEDVSLDRVATLPWLPRAGRDATVASLDTAIRSGAPLSPDAALELWFATTDRDVLARATKAVEAGQMTVVGVARESDARATLADSPASWSLQLGALVGVACLLVAGLGLMIAAAASWRSRTRDLAVLKLNGVPPDRTISLGEQLPAIVVAVLAGATAGVLAAHWAMPTLPLLPSDPPVDLLDLSVAWVPVLVLAAAAVLVLCLLGWLLGALIARRSGLDRVRETA